ncbi:MAG: flagellar motor protein MotD [Rhodocyclaceae bacterium]
MARRKREEAADHHDRWLVSYADFITLLFAFFVVMYAVSSVSEGKYRVLSDSLVAAFRNVTVNSRGVEVAVRPEPPALSTIRPRPRRPARDEKAEAQRREVKEKMRGMAGEIARILQPLVKEGHVRVTETASGVTVEINASVLFAVGDARLAPPAANALRLLAGVIARADLPVTVEGHTDDTPIATAQFPSNWELSVVRASSVVRLFVEAGVPARRLTATGYGEQRPVADNASSAGRARNRRVAILIEAPTVEDIPAEVPIPGEAPLARSPAPGRG